MTDFVPDEMLSFTVEKNSEEVWFFTQLFRNTLKIYLRPQISGGLILYPIKLKGVFIFRYYLYVLIIRLFLPIMWHYLKEKQEKKEFFQ